MYAMTRAVTVFSLGWQRRLALLCACLALVLLGPGQSPAAAHYVPSRNLNPDSLTLGVHPYLNAAELQRRFAPLCAYLSRVCGRPVQWRILPSFGDMAEQFGQPGLELAFTGPTLYVRLRQQQPHLQMLGSLSDGQGLLRGALVVRQDSPLRQVADLRGQTLALVAPYSTMGCMVPRAVLAEHRLGLEDLAAVAFLGNHDNVAYAVLAGRYAAGAVKQEVLDSLQGAGLRVLAPLPPVADHLFIASPTLEPQLVDCLRTALQQLHLSAEGRTLLRALRPDARCVAPVQDSDYDGLRGLESLADTPVDWAQDQGVAGMEQGEEAAGVTPAH